MGYFEEETRAVSQVVRDKDTILEGYVTEFLFEKQFLVGRDGDFTQGWWCANDCKKKYYFIVKEQLNDIDKEFAAKISPFAEVWQAYLTDPGDWCFVCLKSCGNEVVTELRFLSLFSLPTFRSGLIALENVRDKERQEKCVRFFKDCGILTKVAIERCFADDFLFRHFRSAVNIDFITRNRNGVLCVLEVKFKYETRAGKFGVDSGQYQMLTDLMKQGLQVHHIVLYNFTKKKDLTIFGFLANKDPARHWKMCQLKNDDSVYETVAPSYTSIDGRRLQSYFALDKSVFTRTIPFNLTDWC